MTKPDDRLEALVQEVYPHLMLADLSENQEMAILTDFAKQIQQQADTEPPCPACRAIPFCTHECMDTGERFPTQARPDCTTCKGAGTVTLAERDRWQWEQALATIDLSPDVKSDAHLSVFRTIDRLREEMGRRFPK